MTRVTCDQCGQPTAYSAWEQPCPACRETNTQQTAAYLRSKRDERLAKTTPTITSLQAQLEHMQTTVQEYQAEAMRQKLRVDQMLAQLKAIKRTTTKMDETVDQVTVNVDRLTLDTKQDCDEWGHSLLREQQRLTQNISGRLTTMDRGLERRIRQALADVLGTLHAELLEQVQDDETTHG